MATMTEVQALQEQMTQAFQAARAVRTDSTKSGKTAAEVRAQTDAHLKEYYALKAKGEEMLADLKQDTALAAVEQDLEGMKAYMGQSAGVLAGMAQSTGERGQAGDVAIKSAQDAAAEKFYEWCFTGYEEDKRAYIKARTQQIAGKSMYGGFYKSLNAATDTGAGFALAPPELINGIIAAQKNDLIMRQLATVRQSNSIQGTGITTMTTDFSGASWVGEETTVTTDQPVVGKRELVPKYMRSEYIESNVFLEFAPTEFQTWLSDRYAYSFNNIEDQAFISGNGVAKPVGLFEAAAQGAIPTSRDKTASFTTSVTLADVKALYYNLKPQYRRDPTARWVMNRAAVSLVDGISDDNGRPIWNQANIVAGTPETLYGIQIMESENAPSAMTTGTYWSFLGAMRNYWIVDFMGFRVVRLNETHALNMQTGFVGFKAVDGQWMLAEAATRGILA